jgi:hypothetical protein
MAYFFPEGSRFSFSRTFAAAKTVSAVSNASPALATATTHGYVDGDEVLLVSGWEDATDTVYQVDQQTVDAFELLGLNSTNVDFYPAGSGGGSAQKVSNWLEIPQVLTISTTGGDPRFTTISPIARRNSINIPTGFNATSITLNLGHDPSNSTYQEMLDISRSLEKVAFKMVLAGGATVYGYGYLNVSETPSLNVNQANQVSCALTMLGRTMSYAD